MDKNNLDSIIFLIGVNDTRFLKEISNKITTNMDDLTLKDKLKFNLSKKSFIYGKIRILNKKRTDKNQDDNLIQIGHGISKPIFKDKNENNNFHILSSKVSKLSKNYKSLFRELLVTTKDNFPNTKIFIIQQQDPKCQFLNPFKFQTTISEYKHSGKLISEKELISYCKALGNIYRLQDFVISQESFKEKPKVIKMYVDSPIPESGFYDGLHTNKYGSKILGDYISDKLK